MRYAHQSSFKRKYFFFFQVQERYVSLECLIGLVAGVHPGEFLGIFGAYALLELFHPVQIVAVGKGFSHRVRSDCPVNFAVAAGFDQNAVSTLPAYRFVFFEAALEAVPGRRNFFFFELIQPNLQDVEGPFFNGLPPAFPFRFCRGSGNGCDIHSLMVAGYIFNAQAHQLGDPEAGGDAKGKPGPVSVPVPGA